MHNEAKYVEFCTNVTRTIVGYRSLDPTIMKWETVSQNQGFKTNINVLHMGRPYQLTPISTLYLHTIADVIVTSAGGIVDLKGRFKYVQQGCKPNYADIIQ